MIESFRVAELYSNKEVFQALAVGNAGGIRAKTNSDGQVERLVIFTSIPTARQIIENPYQDRMEGDILIYTGAGKEGDQTITGVNARIVQQQDAPFPIYGFAQVGSRRDKSIGKRRWEFLGLLEYLRAYKEQQLDSRGNWRSVWVFELLVHVEPTIVHTTKDFHLLGDLLAQREAGIVPDDREVVKPEQGVDSVVDTSELEPIRRQLLAFEPERFEHVIRSLLEQSGFERVEVTKYSQDGGVDVNASPGIRSWPIRHLLVQVQAKRWLHTVGRKEVAELRGSLQPHAAGCIVTTSHFSRAAVIESVSPGKIPIKAIDGYELASIVTRLKLTLS